MPGKVPPFLFYHEFQHDYRNGVKPWQFDPTKWSIWLLHRLGLVRQLRRAPEEKILLAEVAEQQRLIAFKLSVKPVSVAEPVHRMLQSAHQRLQHAATQWEQCKTNYRQAAEMRMEASRERVVELQKAFRRARLDLRVALREWRHAQRRAYAQLA